MKACIHIKGFAQIVGDALLSPLCVYLSHHDLLIVKQIIACLIHLSQVRHITNLLGYGFCCYHSLITPAGQVIAPIWPPN